MLSHHRWNCECFLPSRFTGTCTSRKNACIPHRATVALYPDCGQLRLFQSDGNGKFCSVLQNTSAMSPVPYDTLFLPIKK